MQLDANLVAENHRATQSHCRMGFLGSSKPGLAHARRACASSPHGLSEHRLTPWDPQHLHVLTSGLVCIDGKKAGLLKKLPQVPSRYVGRQIGELDLGAILGERMQLDANLVAENH